MPRLTVKDGLLFYDTVSVGPASALYCYPGEERALGVGRDSAAGVVVYGTPGRIDLLFTVGERVVGCEVKTVEDLVSSHRSRRLHRQLRTILSMVDIPCLVVRGLLDGELPNSVAQRHPKPDVFWGDWVNWQTQGVNILPVDEERYLHQLCVFRKALATTGQRALAGSDRREERKRSAGWLLRRIPGIGMVRSVQLVAEHGSSIQALQAALRGAVAPTLGRAVEEKLRRAATE